MVSLLVSTPRDGNWGAWSGWTNCSRACNGGTRIRYQFCDNPSSQYGGERLLKEPCNEEACPLVLVSMTNLGGYPLGYECAVCKITEL